jgi:geranyl diphosphate synthase
MHLREPDSMCSLLHSGLEWQLRIEAYGWNSQIRAASTGPTANLHAAAHVQPSSQRSDEQLRWETKNAAESVDPFSLVHQEVQIVSERLRHSVLSSVPALASAAEYFFRPGREGKRLRPTLALLMASALSSEAPGPSLLQLDLRPASDHPSERRRQQQRLAEISELIHVASLLHDDVIDDAETRRGILSLNAMLGNKTAILAGDFLLARASVSLASLRNTQVVELMSQVLENLVSGEIMQMTATQDQLADQAFYLKKTYCKTASLMANSAKSIAVLAGQAATVCDAAESYGRHLGIAFQIVDDILDLTASSTLLGKPALNDIKSGLSTLPVLLAAEEHPELKPLILRKFKGNGDQAEALRLLGKSQGIPQARKMAEHHCMMAAEMVSVRSMLCSFVL